MNLTLEQLKSALQIKEQIAALEARLETILRGGGGGETPSPFFKAQSTALVKRGRRKMSASARARIGEAKKAWWASRKGTSSVAEPVKKKGGMSAAGRARIAAAQRARWAKVKGTSTPAKKKKRHLSAAGRAAIIAAVKRRWATAKKK